MSQPSDTDELVKWLKEGERFFPPSVLEPLREEAARQIMQKLSHLESALKTLGVGVHTEEMPDADASVAKIVCSFVIKHPGVKAGQVIEFVKGIKPFIDEATIHAALYRATRGDDSPLRKEGNRGEFQYFPREAGM